MQMEEPLALGEYSEPHSPGSLIMRLLGCVCVCAHTLIWQETRAKGPQSQAMSPGGLKGEVKAADRS